MACALRRYGVTDSGNSQNAPPILVKITSDRSVSTVTASIR
ncbi:MAG: hypothetical protein P8X74_15875 [Reinekea sp.]